MLLKMQNPPTEQKLLMGTGCKSVVHKNCTGAKCCARNSLKKSKARDECRRLLSKKHNPLISLMAPQHLGW